MANILKSKPTTVTVSTSSLQVASGALASGSFVKFDQPSLSARSPHPTSGIACDVTEDGAQFVGHPSIDWAGKGCYDPVSRRVMWASCGAGNLRDGGYAFNTHAIYSEQTNAWSVRRAFQAPGGAGSNPIGHMYDSNCIDVAGRRFFKKAFPTAEILEFDLDADTWLGVFPSPSDEAPYARDGGMDVVPTRGPRGSLWQVVCRRADNRPQLSECDLSNRRWSVLIPGGSLGAPAGNGSFLSYNPRAFEGAGGALIGTSVGAFIVRADTLEIKVASPPPRPLALPHDGHLCRHPSGPGWVLAGSDGLLYTCDGSSWTERVRLPGILGTSGHRQPLVVVPIDAYGVIWLITTQNSAGRSWLYKP